MSGESQKLQHGEVTLCPICGEDAFWPVSFFDPASDRIVRRGEGYYWRLCRRCGNATPSQRASRAELQSYWERNRVDESAFSVTDGLWARRVWESDIWGRRTYDFVSPRIRTAGRRLLDVGCGLGGTIARFSAEGWQAHGLDPDPNTKPFHDRLGISTQIIRFEEAVLQPPYDLVCIAHAIYFLEDPKDSIRRIRDLLSPDGLCVVVYSHLFSSLNIGRPALAHTWYPTRSSLVYLLNQEGFELIASQTMKGSDMLLFQAGDPPAPKGRPWQALWMHRTQGLRHRTLGTFLRAGLSSSRTIRNALSRH